MTAATPAEAREFAGIRSYRKNRQTGFYVGVYDGEVAGLDTDGGRWQTICEEHDHIVSHDTLALAMSNASVPMEWCDGCQYEPDGMTEKGTR